MNQFGDMKGIETDLGVRELLPCSGLKRSGHVHGDEFDEVGLSFMSDEVLLEILEGVGLTSLHRADGFGIQWVMKDRQIPQAATDELLIDTEGCDVRKGGLSASHLDMGIDRSPDAALGDIE